MLSLPFLVSKVESSIQLFSIQACIVSLNLTGLPADAIFYYHLPIFRRFTLATVLYALSRTIMYIITSFGLVYLGMLFGNFGLWVLTLPITIGYILGVYHFEELEHKLGFYPDISPFKVKGLKNKFLRLFSIKNNKRKKRQAHGLIFKTKS
jgi:hypothetical protein